MSEVITSGYQVIPPQLGLYRRDTEAEEYARQQKKYVSHCLKQECPFDQCQAYCNKQFEGNWSFFQRIATVLKHECKDVPKYTCFFATRAKLYQLNEDDLAIYDTLVATYDVCMTTMKEPVSEGKPARAKCLVKYTGITQDDLEAWDTCHSKKCLTEPAVTHYACQAHCATPYFTKFVMFQVGDKLSELIPSHKNVDCPNQQPELLPPKAAALKSHAKPLHHTITHRSILQLACIALVMSLTSL